MLIAETVMRKIIDQALSLGADFAEVYAEDTRKRQLTYMDRKAHKAISGHTLGAGIRVFHGTEQIYTYTNDLSESGLLRAAQLAAEALVKRDPIKAQTFIPIETFGLQKYASTTDDQYLWTMLAAAEAKARSVSSAVTQVRSELAETFKIVQVFNSEGVSRAENRGYLNGNVHVIAEEAGVREESHDRDSFLGTGQDWEKLKLDEIALSAAGQCVGLLHADWTPAGEMPVVIDNGFGGVIFHEACGHGLETTSVAKGASVFCGRLGEKVAHESVTAIDDGTLEGEYGSLEMDDEGELTRKTVLIEKGILKSYIVDKMGARRTGLAVTGSGRRQDYRFAPTSRMRNTYIAAGESSLEEMIADVDYGLYAKRLGGGSVSPGTGSYNFAVTEGYLIRNGRLDKAVKGASLIGTGIETLGRIVKVSRDLKLSPGTCGSISGMIPVTVGQPQILVSKLTVGGRV